MKYQEKIDKYFENLIGNNSNFLPAYKIDSKMLMKKACPFDNCSYWLPIDSSVNDNEIALLENEIGCKLPKTYIDFLKYKHFYELHFNDCEFIPHPINSWKKVLISEITQDREIFLDKGYIVFAYHLPEGAYCFDTNNDYSIVVWTPENPKIETKYEPNSFTKVFESFEELLNKLNNENMIMVNNNAS